MKTLFILLAAITVIAVSTDVRATDTNTQTNTSGSNTNITGGYTATTTNNNDGQTNTTTNTTTNNSTTNGSAIPVASANSPSLSSMSQDVCSMGISGSVSSTFVGVSTGKHVIDEHCLRMRYAKLLNDLSLKISAVSLLCMHDEIFTAMEFANTMCPAPGGLLGDDAIAFYNKYPKLRPDYDQWLERTNYMKEVDAKDKVIPVTDTVRINVHSE